MENSFRAREFKEISSCGGKIEFASDGTEASVSFSGDTPFAMSLVQMGAALDKGRIEYWPITGERAAAPEQSPMVPTFLPSDESGLWGRICPSCVSYFRSSSVSEPTYCPYCSYSGVAAAFTTLNQKSFLDAQVDFWTSAIDLSNNGVIDLDKLAIDLPSNRPAWTPVDQVQQFQFRCEKCRTRLDILGEFGRCSRCKKRNSLVVFKFHLNELQNESAKVFSNSTEIDSTTQYSVLLPRYISAFEAFSADIRAQLTTVPTTPKRRKEIDGINFQRIIEAHDKLITYFSIDIFEKLDQASALFLEITFRRRHLIIHNAGRVDAKYLKLTDDQSVRLHQTLRISHSDLQRLASILSECAENLYRGMESIS